MYFPQYINPTWFPSLFNHEQNNDFTGRIILPYYVYGPSYAYEYQYEYGNYDDKGSSLFLILFFLILTWTTLWNTRSIQWTMKIC